MKFIYPLVSFILSVGVQTIALCSEYDAVLFVFWAIVYLPFSSFFYSKKFLRGGKRSIPYTLIHSFALSFSYVIFYFSEEDIYGAVLLLFLWCEVWALLGLIRKQKMPTLFGGRLFTRRSSIVMNRALNSNQERVKMRRKER